MFSGLFWCMRCMAIDLLFQRHEVTIVWLSGGLARTYVPSPTGSSANPMLAFGPFFGATGSNAAAELPWLVMPFRILDASAATSFQVIFSGRRLDAVRYRGAFRCLRTPSTRYSTIQSIS